MRIRVRRVLTGLWLGISAVGLALTGHAQAPDAAPVARVMGVALTCAVFGAADRASCARGVLRYARQRVEQDYIERHGLSATPEELAEVAAYNSAFERHDRDQRTRKLAELEERLASATAPPQERERLLAFRDLLVRLAQFDAAVDAGIETRTTLTTPAMRRLVERSKLDAALHARYGGIVGVAASGPYAHGAGIALIEEHVLHGDIVLLDAGLAAAFDAALHAPPPIAHDASAPDFTPFWRRPIPASYMGP